jgi:hypothetical protein
VSRISLQSLLGGWHKQFSFRAAGIDDGGDGRDDETVEETDDEGLVEVGSETEEESSDDDDARESALVLDYSDD